MRFSPEGKTPGKNWPPRKEEVYDTPQEWLRRIGRARVQREKESNARNDLHADSDRRVESPKASRVHSSLNGSGPDTNANVTRSNWLNCALRDDEAVYWVSIGHYEAVAVGN